ncbi:MAG: Zn-ribbon domain-containing OB-fold protein [Dissulfuribacterales bacterium]
MNKDFDTSDCYVVEGKLALPYTYFAGRVGSTFITTIRDQQKIMGVKCSTCDKVFVPPRQTCEQCLEDIRDNWVELGNTGAVVNFTVVRYNDKHLPRKAPFVLAMIKLDNADTPMVHILEGVDMDNVQTGMKVKAVFAEQTTNTILDIDHFEPV